MADNVEPNEESTEYVDNDITAYLLQTAAALADFYKALRDSGVPDTLSFELVADYHREAILYACSDYETDL